MKNNNVKRGLTPDSPLTEHETRLKLFGYAKQLGCEKDLVQILQKYDNVLKGCTNMIERRQMAVMANIEVHKLFNFRNPLIVGGVEILPGEPNQEEKI